MSSGLVLLSRVGPQRQMSTPLITHCCEMASDSQSSTASDPWGLKQGSFGGATDPGTEKGFLEEVTGTVGAEEVHPRVRQRA